MTSERSAEPKSILGFWVYLMTDCILFASLFAAFIVLRNNTYGGSSGAQLFSLKFVLAETLILLTSSFTCGLAMLAAKRGDKNKVAAWFGVTFILGAAFLMLELNEFSKLVGEGNSWQANAFLSSFFTLVGTHGLHISAGLVWMLALIPRILRRGLDSSGLRKLTCLSLFWHFLDIVWIFIFTIVYLLGIIDL